jgi:hypothetical protein
LMKLLASCRKDNLAHQWRSQDLRLWGAPGSK